MRFTPALIDKMAKGVPGEQTELLSAETVGKEKGYTVYKAGEPHPLGMPVAAMRVDGELYITQHDGLCHALVAGSTGCGKSMRYLENCLFNLDGTTSAIVGDVKGELYRNTAAYLKQRYGEDNVKYMDFIRPERSEILFNPIADLARKYLEAELYPEDARYIRNEVFAELKKLFDKLFPVRTSKDVSWDEGARSFIYGITVGLFEDMLLNKEEAYCPTKSISSPFPRCSTTSKTGTASSTITAFSSRVTRPRSLGDMCAVLCTTRPTRGRATFSLWRAI